MISIKTIREKPQSVQDILDLKGYDGSISKIHFLDENYRTINKKLEDFRAQKNKVSEQVAISKRDGTDSNDQIVAMRKLGERIKHLESELNKVKKELNIKYLIDFYNKLKNTDSDFFGKYFYRIAGNKKLENQKAIKKGIQNDSYKQSF